MVYFKNSLIDRFEKMLKSNGTRVKLLQVIFVSVDQFYRVFEAMGRFKLLYNFNYPIQINAQALGGTII